MTPHNRTGLSAWSQPLLLALGFAVLVGINAVSFWLLTQSQSAHEHVVRTLDLENQLGTVLRALRRAESTQRGYLLTGQDVYLEDYRSASAEIPALFDELRDTMANNPSQLERLDALEVPVRMRLTELAEVVSTRDRDGLEAAIAMMDAATGRRHIEDAREIVERMIGFEAAIVQQQTAASERTILQLFAINLAGSLLILLVGGTVLYVVRRSQRERDEANDRLAAANFDLEASIAERTAELEEANQELQRYAYIVSHDLRSPLVNIMGFTAELEEMRGQLFDSERRASLGSAGNPQGEAAESDGDELKASYDEALGFIKASTTRMDNLIHAILRLSREGQRKFKPETIDMTSFVEAIASTLAHQTEEAGAEIEIRELPEVVSDRLALEQVFSNLLDNAVKYLDPERPGRIEIRGREVLGHAVYEVADNGRGIPEKDHRRIFELFRRSGAQDRPGEGIGLAHVRTLVRRLGGRITVKSEPGEGSVFTVTLPLYWPAERERNTA